MALRQYLLQERVMFKNSVLGAMAILMLASRAASAGNFCTNILLNTHDKKIVEIEAQSFLEGSTYYGYASSGLKTDEGDYIIRFSQYRTANNEPGIVIEFEIPMLERVYFVLPNSALNLHKANELYRVEFFKPQQWTRIANGEMLLVDFVINDFSNEQTPRLYYYQLKFSPINREAGTAPEKLEIAFEQMKEK
jgi:hypothetical protein